ncbi:glycosyltransferase [Phocaeicola plebeius]|jgi:glycosyltransferase involved in cell wall biosynthesis|uniref:glycosyltransferase n=1 Tax=Phocaeicola plebeius TaxID=310297 RepID=UPI0022E25AF8|nr:glycosyltransferase [Phocaeicola plebeius]
MKVIHFIPSIDRTSGGVGAYMQLLSKELGKLCELHIVTSKSENPLPVENATLHYIPCNITAYFKMKKEWISLLNTIHPDIVHVNCCWLPCSAFTQKWAQQLGFKVILSPHGMLEPWIISRNYWTKKLPALLLYQKSAVVNADHIHATARSEKENLLKLGYNNKIEIVANGIDVDSIVMKDNWERKKKILFLSRIHVKKGIEFLLEATALLKEQLTDYTINIAGEGDYDYIVSLKNRAQELGIEKMVNFCGGVYGEMKWKLFRDADVFILPTYSENFGIVVGEALACGTPVITTKGTPWEELNTEHCGWWTEIGTDATFNALKDFLSLSKDELMNMGNNGRKLIKNKYSAPIIAQNMFLLYKRTFSK